MESASFSEHELLRVDRLNPQPIVGDAPAEGRIASGVLAAGPLVLHRC